MTNPSSARLIMVVGQEPFDVDVNRFCKLVPLAFVNGTVADIRDFSNDGEIWWMLTARTAPLARPGVIVTGELEPALRFDPDNPSSSKYQVVRESVTEMPITEGMVVFDLQGDVIADVRDLVSSRISLHVSGPITPHVLIRWRDAIYGPFSVSASRDSENAGTEQTVTFRTLNKDLTVFSMQNDAFQAVVGEYRLPLSADVSLTKHPRAEAHSKRSLSIELLLSQGYEKFLAADTERLLLEPLEHKLNRYAKQCLSRRRRRELRDILEELELKAREIDAEELLHSLAEIKDFEKRHEASLHSVAQALLESGMLGEERLRKAEERHAAAYVQQRTAALQSQIEEQLKGKREELRKATDTLTRIQDRIAQERETALASVREDIASLRRVADRDIAAERKTIEDQKQELERQQGLLQQNLEKVTQEFRDAGDEAVNRFLTILPFLPFSSTHVATPVAAEPEHHTPTAPKPARAFDVPRFVAHAAADPAPCSEEEFFERFTGLVERCGFSYRTFDLRRFHVSVKCGALTVLSGPSGVGKSSLPVLYTRALNGDGGGIDRPDCLMVNVNPSWLEIRDLIGHMNTLEGRYYPAETGLYERLIRAQEEYHAQEARSGLHLICLDEMNLSQIEHYFSDFMMVLERPDGERQIQCFAPDVSSPSCPFHKWSRLSIPSSVRFVGTVNFDETTRLLSDRLLDRCNLLDLQAATLPDATIASGMLAPSLSGPMVTVSDFDTWQGNVSLPRDLASLLDGLRPIFQRLGCPISPRVYRAICQFVGSAEPILSEAAAFDSQLAQRVLPKVRNLVTQQQLDALDELYEQLSNSDVASFDESARLLQDIRTSALGRDWLPEE
jgi:hypothetical protein